MTNREPFKMNPYLMLPLGSVKPKGWFQEMLVRQKTLSTGNLDELYPLSIEGNNKVKFPFKLRIS